MARPNTEGVVVQFVSEIANTCKVPLPSYRMVCTAFLTAICFVASTFRDRPRGQAKILGISQDLEVWRHHQTVGNFQRFLGRKWLFVVSSHHGQIQDFSCSISLLPCLMLTTRTRDLELLLTVARGDAALPPLRQLAEHLYCPSPRVLMDVKLCKIDRLS